MCFLPWRAGLTQLVWHRKTPFYVRLAPGVAGCYRMQNTTTRLRWRCSVSACILPEARIAPETVKGDVDVLRLVKPTWAGSFRGATAPPSTARGHPARRASRFAYPVNGGQYPQGKRGNLLPPLSPRGQAFVTTGRSTVYTLFTNMPQATARNARSDLRQQQVGTAAGSATISHQLRERQDSTPQRKRRRGHGPTLHLGVTCALTTVQPVGRTNTRTRRALG